VGLRAGPDIAEMARGYSSLANAEARAAFLHTVRAVIDYNGQRVSAADRLYLSSMLPSLIVWGRRDPLIPAVHGEDAHRLMPGSRLEIFESAGHFPQLDDPMRFAAVLREFLEETEPAEFDFTDDDFDALRERILEHSRS
jgi:pimeloyl-ACP methyl ester carboxylesterase